MVLVLELLWQLVMSSLAGKRMVTWLGPTKVPSLVVPTLVMVVKARNAVWTTVSVRYSTYRSQPQF